MPKKKAEEVAAASDDWFISSPKEGFAKKTQIDKVTEMKREKSAPRFMLKAGEEAVIVFVDTNPIFVWEHNLEIAGKWGNHFTCVKEKKTCPICHNNSQDKSVYIAYFTVIDTREFTRKDGTKVKNRKVLYPAKGSSMPKVEDLIKKYGSLSGLAFKVKRYTKQEPNCGTTFDKIGKVDLVKKFGVGSDKPFEYKKILIPPTAEELESLGISMTIVGSEGIQEEVSSDLESYL